MIDSDFNNEENFDWASIRRRIDEVGSTLEESVEVSQREVEEVWAERAAELAKVPTEEDESEYTRLILVRLGREIYGIEAHYVFNVRTADKITYVPRVPKWVAGVVNLRGRIFSVLDLRRFFDLSDAGDIAEGDSLATKGVYPRLVVVETPDMEIALLVDEVLTVESLPMGQIQDATGTVRGLRPEYVQGVIARRNKNGKDEGKNNSMVVVLDLVALLADERLIVHEEIV